MPPTASGNHPPRKSTRSRKSRAGEVEVSERAADQVTGSDEVVDGEGQESLSPKKTAERKRAKTSTSEDVNFVEPVQIPGGTKRKRKIVEEQEIEVDGSTPKKVKGHRTAKEEDRSLQSDGETLPTPERPSKKVVKEEKREEDILPTKISSEIKAQTKKIVKQEAEEDSAIVKGSETGKKSKGKKTKVKQEAAEVHESDEDAEIPQKPKRKRKTKEEKEAEAMPLAARTAGLNMFVGAHVSCAKGPLAPLCRTMYIVSMKLNRSYGIGVHNTVTNCLHIG